MGQNLIKSIEIAAAAGDDSFDLAHKGLSEVPSDIEKLGGQVHRLALGNNYLSKLPNEIIALTNLRYLNIRGNQFKQFPTLVSS